MIDSVAEFSSRLDQLNPADDAFVTQVDDLVEVTSPETLELAYEAVFRFFETYPDEYCGMPGTLVHVVESYYPSYVEALIASIDRTPSLNTVLMVNRILNSQIDTNLRARLADCLRDVSQHATATPHVRRQAGEFLERHA